jgi:hypothetical protein
VQLALLQVAFIFAIVDGLNAPDWRTRERAQAMLERCGIAGAQWAKLLAGMDGLPAEARRRCAHVARLNRITWLDAVLGDDLALIEFLPWLDGMCDDCNLRASYLSRANVVCIEHQLNMGYPDWLQYRLASRYYLRDVLVLYGPAVAEVLVQLGWANEHSWWLRRLTWSLLDTKFTREIWRAPRALTLRCPFRLTTRWRSATPASSRSVKRTLRETLSVQKHTYTPSSLSRMLTPTLT